MNFIEKKIKSLKEQFTKEYEILPARCSTKKRDFNILLVNQDGVYTMEKGVKIYNLDGLGGKGGGTKNSSTRKLDVSNGLKSSEKYSCPECGNKRTVKCGVCHTISCYDNSGYFKCDCCGNGGKVTGTIKSLDIYDQNGTKQNKDTYVKANNYPPGDKKY